MYSRMWIFLQEPLTVSSFFDDYYGKKLAHIQHQQLGAYNNFFDIHNSSRATFHDGPYAQNASSFNFVQDAFNLFQRRDLLYTIAKSEEGHKMPFNDTDTIEDVLNNQGASLVFRFEDLPSRLVLCHYRSYVTMTTLCSIT